MNYRAKNSLNPYNSFIWSLEFCLPFPESSGFVATERRQVWSPSCAFRNPPLSQTMPYRPRVHHFQRLTIRDCPESTVPRSSHCLPPRNKVTLCYLCFWGFFLFIFKGFFFFWLCHEACGIVIHGPGTEPMPPAVEMQNFNHLDSQGKHTYVSGPAGSLAL